MAPAQGASRQSGPGAEWLGSSGPLPHPPQPRLSPPDKVAVRVQDTAEKQEPHSSGGRLDEECCCAALPRVAPGGRSCM